MCVCVRVCSEDERGEFSPEPDGLDYPKAVIEIREMSSIQSVEKSLQEINHLVGNKIFYEENES